MNSEAEYTTISTICGYVSDPVSYLQLQHPGAVPVGHIAPFDKELPLPAARQRWGIRSISRQVSRPGDRCGGWRLPPAPCYNLLNFAFHRWTLSGRGEDIIYVLMFINEQIGNCTFKIKSELFEYLEISRMKT